MTANLSKPITLSSKADIVREVDKLVALAMALERPKHSILVARGVRDYAGDSRAIILRLEICVRRDVGIPTEDLSIPALFLFPPRSDDECFFDSYLGRLLFNVNGGDKPDAPELPHWQETVMNVTLRGETTPPRAVRGLITPRLWERAIASDDPRVVDAEERRRNTIWERFHSEPVARWQGSGAFKSDAASPVARGIPAPVRPDPYDTYVHISPVPRLPADVIAGMVERGELPKGDES